MIDNDQCHVTNNNNKNNNNNYTTKNRQWPMSCYKGVDCKKLFGEKPKLPLDTVLILWHIIAHVYLSTWYNYCYYNYCTCVLILPHDTILHLSLFYSLSATVLYRWHQVTKFYMGPLQTELHYTVTLLHITAQCAHVCLLFLY